jgi:hypothetical protein
MKWQLYSDIVSEYTSQWFNGVQFEVLSLWNSLKAKFMRPASVFRLKLQKMWQAVRARV